MSKTKFFNFKDLFKGEESENSSDVNPTISVPETYKSYLDTEEGQVKNAALSEALKNYSGYGSHNWENEGLYNQLLKKKINREPFSYDLDADALYQQYKDQYMQKGKLAMEDTMGQASAMTGGYGNSYAATVGNQAYQAYLGELNDVIPELYQMALQKYTMDGEQIDSNLAALGEDYNMSFDKWQTEYDRLKDKYDIANSDYHNSASLYGTEQDSMNSIAQTNYENEREEVTSLNAQVPDSVRKKLDSMTSNTEVESYLENLEATGVILHDTALQLMAEYMDSNEIYIDNDDGSKSISYSGMIATTKGWSVEDDGGANFVGIDEDAKVQTPNGEIITLKNLKEKLIAEGMSSSEARNAIKKLQQNLGISSNWFFGL